MESLTAGMVRGPAAPPPCHPTTLSLPCAPSRRPLHNALVRSHMCSVNGLPEQELLSQGLCSEGLDSAS